MDRCAPNENNIKHILNENDLKHIVKQTTDQNFEIVDYNIRSASVNGLKGFVGDHFRATVSVKENDCERTMHLFIKILPLENKPKEYFIVENQFFKREALMFTLLEEMREQEATDLNSWHTKAYIYNDKMLVMPDLCVQGYRVYPVQKYFDKTHIFPTLASVARFHAAVARYESKKRSEDHNYKFLDVHGKVVSEPTFCDSNWIRAAAKLTNNLLREFSSEVNQAQYPSDMEDKIWKLYVKGSNSLKEYRDTLNVIIHKDLWANNILFKYEGDKATNAVLLDFQCIRYGPPAFDVIYLTTSRQFRERYEASLLRYYYECFTESIDELTEKRLSGLNYDEDAFLGWCEKARLFGMVVPLAIFPYTLMEPNAAQTAFDDPETYVEYSDVDRSMPVLAHARENWSYRDRQLEISEEFVERFVTD